LGQNLVVGLLIPQVAVRRGVDEDRGGFSMVTLSVPRSSRSQGKKEVKEDEAASHGRGPCSRSMGSSSKIGSWPLPGMI